MQSTWEISCDLWSAFSLYNHKNNNLAIRICLTLTWRSVKSSRQNKIIKHQKINNKKTSISILRLHAEILVFIIINSDTGLIRIRNYLPSRVVISKSSQPRIQVIQIETPGEGAVLDDRTGITLRLECATCHYKAVLLDLECEGKTNSALGNHRIVILSVNTEAMNDNSALTWWRKKTRSIWNEWMYAPDISGFTSRYVSIVTILYICGARDEPLTWAPDPVSSPSVIQSPTMKLW